MLEDDGNRQLVELEQLASWRFLWLSGTLSACVLVDQDRSTHMVLVFPFVGQCCACCSIMSLDAFDAFGQ